MGSLLETLSRIADTLDKISENLKPSSHGTLVSPTPNIAVGDKVEFNPKGNATVTGVVTRINQKIVTVDRCSDGGPGWRMPADRLRKITT